MVGNVEPTLPSVPSKQIIETVHETIFWRLSVCFNSFLDCGISFQNQFGSNPRLIKLCLKSLSEFFLTVDSSYRLNTFYVLNDLIQVRHSFDIIVYVLLCLSRLT